MCLFENMRQKLWVGIALPKVMIDIIYVEYLDLIDAET